MSAEDIEVNYLVHEDIVARQDRTIRSLLKMVLAQFILMVFMAVGFFWYESQFTTETVTVSQEAETFDGDNMLINNSGVMYGEGKADSQNNKEGP